MSKWRVPVCIFEIFLVPIINRIFLYRLGCNLDDLVPSNAAKKCQIPALFLHGDNDKFVVPENSEINFEAYAGPEKVLKMVKGADHRSERPEETF